MKNGTQTLKYAKKEMQIYSPPEINQIADGYTHDLDFIKWDAYSAGLLFLVCCGLPQEKIHSIDKSEEQRHNSN